LNAQATDKNKDGKISFQEFLESFREQTEAMVHAVEFDEEDSETVTSKDDDLPA